MCIFCANGSNVWCGSQKMRVLRTNDAETGAPAFILTQGFDDDAQTVTLQVKYCPWCGEKLDGKKATSEYVDKSALMMRLEERQAFLVKEWGPRDHYTRGFEEAVDKVKSIPSADVVPTSEYKALKAYMCEKVCEQDCRGCKYREDDNAAG